MKLISPFVVLQKLADANLMAKWKKAGYERLCCTHAINPRNHNFGTVSVCRVSKMLAAFQHNKSTYLSFLTGPKTAAGAWQNCS
jgi:hypothetical protein